MKYRKKPVVIDAVRFDGTVNSIIGMVKDLDAPTHKWTISPQCLVIPTLEGNMVANVGDWIIKGVQGEFYPCKPDIFEMTYEVI